MAISPEMQRRAMTPVPQVTPKGQMKQKVHANFELLRVASGANSIQGFGRIAIGAIIISVIFSLATLLSVMYDEVSLRVPVVVTYAYPVFAGVIIYLFYEAIKIIRDGYIMFERSKAQEDEALETYMEQALSD